MIGFPYRIFNRADQSILFCNCRLPHRAFGVIVGPNKLDLRARDQLASSEVSQLVVGGLTVAARNFAVDDPLGTMLAGGWTTPLPSVFRVVHINAGHTNW